MERFWKETALALVLGMILPWLCLIIGARRTVEPENTGQPQLSDTQAALEQTQQTQPTAAVFVSVRTDDNTVSVMELEDYLLCVVLAEMPASFAPEALKAQAIVARTYTLSHMESSARHTDAAVCTDPECCQAYITEADYLANRGKPEDVEKIRSAVRQTEGTVLTYEGKLIEATYFSCSGGRTEDAAAVWGTEIPYLQSVDSPGEEASERYWESVYYSAGEFCAALGRKLSGAPPEWLGTVTYTEGGGVARMMIGGLSYSGTQLRQLLELNSTVFEMIPGQYGITVEMLGHGHRVGMSQYGANAMAEKGHACEQILTYYYQGVVIDKVNAIG